MFTLYMQWTCYVSDCETCRKEDCKIEHQQAPFNMAQSFKSLSQPKRNINGELPSIFQRPSSSGMFYKLLCSIDLHLTLYIYLYKH